MKTVTTMNPTNSTICARMDILTNPQADTNIFGHHPMSRPAVTTLTSNIKDR